MQAVSRSTWWTVRDLQRVPAPLDICIDNKGSWSHSARHRQQCEKGVLGFGTLVSLDPCIGIGNANWLAHPAGSGKQAATREDIYLSDCCSSSYTPRFKGNRIPDIDAPCRCRLTER